jgi:aspartate/methionine/tyrosine aminotransferase
MVSRKASLARSQDTSSASATPAPALSETPTVSEAESARALIAELREAASAQARERLTGGAAPIRIMAAMVAQLEARARELELPRESVGVEIVNRTIGDIDVRRITARDDGPEFVSLADDMGLALPGEEIDGRPASGKTYRWIHRRMQEFERELLARHFDLRVYDLAGIGNPLLREMLAARTERQWGIAVPVDQLFLSLGSLDGLGKFFQGLMANMRQRGMEQSAILFPAPGFNVPEWQAKTLGFRIHRVQTHPEDYFKVTPELLRTALDEAPDLRAFYLTVSSNPTAFAYTSDELRALFATLHESGRDDVMILADLAYIGTGDPEADYARMQPFMESNVLERSVLCFSFSKTHTLTGDRCGWVAFGNPRHAMQVAPGWTNSTASLPAEWQLRYMAYAQLFDERPKLEERVRALYRHRRTRLVRQLAWLNQRHHVFAQINLDDGGTVYNWSQLAPGEDVFSLFGKTGIAGVPGGAFGYSDDFVRLSVGCIPVPAVE